MICIMYNHVKLQFLALGFKHREAVWNIIKEFKALKPWEFKIFWDCNTSCMAWDRKVDNVIQQLKDE